MSKQVKFKWDKSQAQLIEDKGITEKLNLYMAQTCYKEMFDYVPYETGALAETTEIKANEEGGEIHFKQPYAHYQYNGVDFNFNKDLHPLATHHWDQFMWVMKKDKITRQVDKYRKELSK